jgi:hypothetical protein
MPRVSIIREDGMVVIDSRGHKVDLSDMPPRIHAVQWDGARGHIEYVNGPGLEYMPQEPIADLAAFAAIRDRWQAAEDAAQPIPPTPEEIAAQEAIAAREALFRGDTERIDILTRLKTATLAQIEAFVDANIPSNQAGARKLLKMIIKAIALDARS